jgi:hypothetical protein
MWFHTPQQLILMALDSVKENIKKKITSRLGRIPATIQLIKAETLMDEFTTLAKSADQLAAFGGEEFTYPPMSRSTAQLVLDVLNKNSDIWFTWVIRYDLEPAMLLHIARAEMAFEDQSSEAATAAEVDGFVTAFTRLMEKKSMITPEVVITLARRCAAATNWETIMKREMNKPYFRLRRRPIPPYGGWSSDARNDHH